MPSESPIVQAAAGWAHCVVVTERGEVYTWGECVPASKLNADTSPRVLGGGGDKDLFGAQAEERDGGEEGLFSRPLTLTDLSDSPEAALTASIETTLKNKGSSTLKGKASSPIAEVYHRPGLNKAVRY